MTTNVVDTLAAGLGVTPAQYYLIVIYLGSLIFMAKDLRLGLIFLFFLNVLGVSVFYVLGRDVSQLVISTMVSFVILTISLLITYSKDRYI